MLNKSLSFSNFLIILSCIVTLISFAFQPILAFWMNSYFLISGNYPSFLVQFLLYQFLHGGILHLLSNSLFIYIFWNQLEFLLWSRRYVLFFLLNTIFVGAALLFFSSGNTIGISGFAMALLAFVFLELKRVWNPEYRGAFIFLVINVLIGLSGSISLVWHLFGAIFWLLYFFILKSFSQNRYY